MVIASCLKRSIIPSPSISPGDMTLIATLRSSEMSCARNTAAIPPRPNSRPMSNSPSVARRSRSTMSVQGEGESLCVVVGSGKKGAGVPQWGHDRSVERSVWPQEAHDSDSAPHCAQKRSPTPRSPPQCRQMMEAAIFPPVECRA